MLIKALAQSLKTEAAIGGLLIPALLVLSLSYLGDFLTGGFMLLVFALSLVFGTTCAARDRLHSLKRCGFFVVLIVAALALDVPATAFGLLMLAFFYLIKAIRYDYRTAQG